MRAKTACFTGHRNIPAEQYDALNQRLEHIIVHLIDRGYRFWQPVAHWDLIQWQPKLCSH